MHLVENNPWGTNGNTAVKSAHKQKKKKKKKKEAYWKKAL